MWLFEATYRAERSEGVLGLDRHGPTEISIPEDGRAQHFYAAWGNAPEQQIKDLVIREEGRLKTVDATWWYGCSQRGDTLWVNTKIHTFNARKLDQEYWQTAIHYHRGIAICTAIGEAIGPVGNEQRFFVQSGSIDQNT